MGIPVTCVWIPNFDSQARKGYTDNRWSATRMADGLVVISKRTLVYTACFKRKKNSHESNHVTWTMYNTQKSRLSNLCRGT